jgi:hypothetical protein
MMGRNAAWPVCGLPMIVVVTVCILSACGSSGGPCGSESADSFVGGRVLRVGSVTTMSDVCARLGSPASVTPLAHGREAWHYESVDGGPASNQRVKLTLTFDGSRLQASEGTTFRLGG